MKQTITKLLGGALCALFLMFSISASAQTTLASWTFDTGYNVAENVYTPNKSDWAEVGTQWFKDGQPQILPNTFVGTQSNYYVTGKTSRYWGINEGYSNHVFRIVNDTEANSITDYTDKSQHNNYYEIQFPTTGYRNISIAYAIAYGDNAAADIHAVYSVDNGTTWKNSNVGYTATGWWTYNENTAYLNADAKNKEKVIVRLIFGNGYSSNWNMDYLTISGESTGDTPSTSTLTFSAPDAEGIAPASVTQALTTTYTIPSNFTVYKEGYTLTGWSDGTTTYSIGNNYTFTEDNTVLSAVFTANTVSLADRTAATEIVWSFRRDQGAPIVSWQGSGHDNHIWVGQATIGGQSIDVKMSLDASSGKFSNTGNTDCTQTTSGTTFVIPSCKDAVVELQCHGSFTITTTTIDGNSTYDSGSGTTTVTKTITGTTGQSTIVIGDGSYYRYVKITLPAQPTRTITIGDAKYATYYNSVAYTLPANLQAATVDGNSGGTLTLNYRYNAGDVVPGGTAVLLKATAAGDYTLTMQPADATAAPAGNLLCGSDVATTTTGGAKYYALMNGSKGLGFYWVNDGGAAFESAAHKAWLALPATPAHFFSLDDDVTAINKVEMKKVEDGVFYNLAGQQVAQPTKGLYIVNGKKVVIK